MISRLHGKIIESNPLLVVLQISGVGYEIHIPLTTAEKIPAVGVELSLFIHCVYREDSATLYGFISREDRDFFRLLVEKVSGIGPKIGISILSRMSTNLLSKAIAAADVAQLSSCPGIGKKTAERIVIELKDKVGHELGIGTSSSYHSKIDNKPSAFQDAISSLITLGYKASEAEKLVDKAMPKTGSKATVEELIKEALS